MTAASILLASAGRRPYLVKWFTEALVAQGVHGHVVLADMDELSSARAFTEVFVPAPAADDPRYEDWLRDTLRDHGVTLALSVNDFELSRWSRLSGPEFASLVRLSPEIQDAVEDKRIMASLLSAHGVLSPQLHSVEGLARRTSDDDRELVLKGRYGSGSRGLRVTTSRRASDVLQSALGEVTHRTGEPAGADVAPDEVLIAQDRIRGDEYGLDIVCDLAGEFVGVLARHKLGMRAGETDRAVTIDPRPFEQLGRKLSECIPHRGVLDVDVIVDQEGHSWVIDVNPRFGGGYPFSHVAGADVPAALVAWLIGRGDARGQLAYEYGVTGSKSVDIVRLP
jgi:carbamoyl-phosphate synthase large subunit